MKRLSITYQCVNERFVSRVVHVKTSFSVESGIGECVLVSQNTVGDLLAYPFPPFLFDEIMNVLEVLGEVGALAFGETFKSLALVLVIGLIHGPVSPKPF